MARVLLFRAALWLARRRVTNLDTSGSQLMSTLLEEHVQRGGLALVGRPPRADLAASTRHLALST